LGKLSRCHRAFGGQRFVKSKTVADLDERGVGGRAHIADHLAHECIQFVGIDVHDGFPSRSEILATGSIASHDGRWREREITTDQLCQSFT